MTLNCVAYILLRGGFNENISNSNFKMKTFFFEKKAAGIILEYQSFNINRF